MLLLLKTTQLWLNIYENYNYSYNKGIYNY